MKTAPSFKFLCWYGFVCLTKIRKSYSFFYDLDDEDKRFHRTRDNHHHRDWYLHEKINPIRNGAYPIFDCPRGHYRDFGDPQKGRPGGILLDGCMKCPKGHYGNSTGLKSPQCTSPCPKGTYLDRKGGTSLDDCISCPEGTYGEKQGMISSQCSGSCSDHNTNKVKYYSNQKGLTTRDECKVCPEGYFGWQCMDRNRRRTSHNPPRHQHGVNPTKEDIFDYSTYIANRKKSLASNPSTHAQ
jgi:hypothetical protein